MSKIKFIILLTITSLIFLSTKSFAVNNTGEATAYKIKMRYLELCETGSTNANCKNPLVIGTGNSGLINIADTAAGATAAAYGDLTTVPIGKSYTYYQVTLERKVIISGSVSDGSNTCLTNASDFSIDTAERGKVGGTANTVELYMAMTTSGLGDDINSIDTPGTGTAQAAGTVDDDDEYLQVRGKFTKAITIKDGKLPVLKLAFGTTNALGYVGASGGCTLTNGEQQGLYGAAPDVTATVVD